MKIQKVNYICCRYMYRSKHELIIFHLRTASKYSRLFIIIKSLIDLYVIISLQTWMIKYSITINWVVNIYDVKTKIFNYFSRKSINSNNVKNLELHVIWIEILIQRTKEVRSVPNKGIVSIHRQIKSMIVDAIENIIILLILWYI